MYSQHAVNLLIALEISTEGWGVSDLAVPGGGFGRAGGFSFGGGCGCPNLFFLRILKWT